MPGVAKKIRTDPVSGCWLWTAGRDQYGYGQIKIRGKTCQAHRFIYTWLAGPIPPGFILLHSCDNPGCVNPAHLSTGTQADNVADRDRKRCQAQGVRNGRSKFTDLAQVVGIIEAHRAGATVSGLARENGVSRRAIRFIVTGQHYGDALKLAGYTSV